MKGNVLVIQLLAIVLSNTTYAADDSGLNLSETRNKIENTLTLSCKSMVAEEIAYLQLELCEEKVKKVVQDYKNSQLIVDSDEGVEATAEIRTEHDEEYKISESIAEYTVGPYRLARK